MSKPQLPKPLIFGISGITLSEAEREVYTKIQPLGFILFKKNLVDKEQVSKLCAELRELVGRGDAPILVDQEGGSVNRLRPPLWRQPPSPLELGKFAYANIDNALQKAAKLVNLNGQLTAYEMQEIGINANCAPVADLLIPGTHHITSTRSFGPDRKITTILVNNMIDGMGKCGVQAIMKHMLGQGRGKVDSHMSLPIVTEDLATLEQTDFAVFKNAKNAKWGMTAHITYNCLDDTLPVTYSRKVIDYIRNVIGFGDILVSDCLTMKALPETLGIKAARTISAGIDIALYGSCSVDYFNEMAQNIPYMTDESLRKVRASFAHLGDYRSINYNTTLAEYNDLLNATQNELNSLPTNKYSPDLEFIIQTLRERSSKNADYSSPLYKA